MVTLSASPGVPTRAGHEVSRQRLLEALHRHGSRPLILLIAPAGFGKSTLAAAYARGSGAVVAWLTLEANDRDARALFSRVAGALETAFADQRAMRGLRRALQDGVEGVGLARALTADLARAPAGFILVLDDYHVVHGVDEVEQSVDAVVRSLPEQGQVVVTAREAPYISGTRLVTSGAVFVLGTEDLRFTPEETAALRAMIGGDPDRDAQAEGWVAGILLGGAPSQLSAAGGSLLGVYVEREILARLRPSAQRWLETLAVLDTVTPLKAGRLIGAGPWPGRLAMLAQHCHFLRADEGDTYRLHSLVRQALLDRLRRGGEARATRAWRLARQMAEEEADVGSVIRACHELGEIEDAVGLVRRSVQEAMQVGRWSAALAHLNLLPEAVRRADPHLSLTEANALVQSGHPAEAKLAVAAALQHGGRTGDVAVQVGAILEEANIARYTGDVVAAEDWLAAALHLLGEARLPASHRHDLEGRARGLRGICAAVRNQLDRARADLQDAERILELNGTSRELAVVQGNIGTLSTRLGDFATAKKALAASATHWRLVGDRGTLAAVQTTLGNVYQQTGETDAAGATLTAALEAARMAGAVRTEGHILVSLGIWHRSNGRIANAIEHFEDGLHLAEDLGERELLVRALRLRAEIAILQEDLQLARDFLARAQAEAQALASDYDLAAVERALGRLHLVEGAGQRAISYLEAALERGARSSPDEQAATWYWLGTAFLTVGRAHKADEALATALDLAEQSGGMAVLANIAAEDLRLVHHGSASQVRVLQLGEVERLAATRQPWTERVSPVRLVVNNDTALPRLEVRLFGPLMLFRDGERLDSEARRVDRVHKLLALLLLHPEGLSSARIVELLWPEMPPQRALHNLRMVAYLLRQTLGGKNAITHAASAYRLASHLDLFVDMRAFDASLAAARRATEGIGRAEALARAVDLYRGPLLEGVDWPWVENFRHAYAQRFADAAVRLAETVAASDPDRAWHLCERVLATDPYDESAHRVAIAIARQKRDTDLLGRALARQRLASREMDALLQEEPVRPRR